MLRMQDKDTPLHIAARKNKFEMVEHLIKKKANVLAKNAVRALPEFYLCFLRVINKTAYKIVPDLAKCESG